MKPSVIFAIILCLSTVAFVPSFIAWVWFEEQAADQPQPVPANHVKLAEMHAEWLVARDDPAAMFAMEKKYFRGSGPLTFSAIVTRFRPSVRDGGSYYVIGSSHDSDRGDLHALFSDALFSDPLESLPAGTEVEITAELFDIGYSTGLLFRGTARPWLKTPIVEQGTGIKATFHPHTPDWIKREFDEGESMLLDVFFGTEWRAASINAPPATRGQQ